MASAPGRQDGIAPAFQEKGGKGPDPAVVQGRGYRRDGRLHKEGRWQLRRRQARSDRSRHRGSQRIVPHQQAWSYQAETGACYETDYVEQGEHFEHLYRMVDRRDGYMEEVHGLRE